MDSGIQEFVMPWGIISVCVLLCVVIMAIWMALMPRYNVWKAHKTGEADLMRAKNEQQIQIAQAQSRLDAAQLNKQAAIVEAEAVTKQIETIGKNLTEHDLYLKWQWINMMEKGEGKNKTIYVPTECNLPILASKK